MLPEFIYPCFFNHSVSEAIRDIKDVRSLKILEILKTLETLDPLFKYRKNQEIYKFMKLYYIKN